MNRVAGFSSEKKFGKFEKEIRRTAAQALKILKKDGVSIEIFLLGQEKMRALNKKFRGKDKTADVGGCDLGDAVSSAEE